MWICAGELDEGEVEGGAELAVDAQDFFTEAELEIGRTARWDQRKIVYKYSKQISRDVRYRTFGWPDIRPVTGYIKAGNLVVYGMQQLENAFLPVQFYSLISGTRFSWVAEYLASQYPVQPIAIL